MSRLSDSAFTHKLAYRLTIADITGLLDDKIFPPDKQMFLVELMCKFEICFLAPDLAKYLIPDWLPKSQPDFVWNGDQCLKFQYKYDVLPSSIMTRFIVRINEYAFEKKYWRNGIVVQSRDVLNRAFIRADLNVGEILIEVDGNIMTRRDLLNSIRTHFDSIHQTVIGLQTQELVPVPGYSSVPPVPYNHLLRLEAKGIQKFLWLGMEDEIEVKSLLYGVITIKPIELKSVIAARFDISEFHGLCDDIGIDFESLEGNAKQAKVDALVRCVQRDGLYTELTKHIRRLRPGAL